MKTETNQFKKLIIPALYLIFIYFWKYTSIVLNFLFSDISLKFHKFYFLKNEKSELILPLQDFIVFISFSWFSILFFILMLFFFIKNNQFRKGIYITIFFHLIVLLYLLFVFFNK